MRLCLPRSRRHLTEATHHLLRASTPYGPLWLPAAEGRAFGVLSPQAMLHQVAANSPGFAAGLASFRGREAPVRVLIFGDELQPGNVLRPDPGRKLWAWYWTIADLPPRELRSEAWWLPLAFARSSEVDKLGGAFGAQVSQQRSLGIWADISQGIWKADKYARVRPLLLREILSTFWPGPAAPVTAFDFLHVGVVCGVGEHAVVIRAVLGGLLMDEKGMKDCLSLKGASGSRPCCLCRNLVARVEQVRDSAYAAGPSDRAKCSRRAPACHSAGVRSRRYPVRSLDIPISPFSAL